MRTTQQARRIQNNVMKSPSPDIANRNIIKDTKTPIDDVKRYLQKSNNSRSPRASDLNQSARFQNNGNEIEMLRQRIAQLQFKVKQLTNQNEQYRKALEDKASMQGQIARMRETIRSYQGSQVVTPRSQSQSKTAMDQMQERVMNLLKQNTRLGGLLQDKESNFQGLSNENKKLKMQIDNLKIQLQTSRTNLAAPIGPTQAFINSQYQSQDTNQIKTYYQNKIEPQMRRSQTEWLNKIRELSDKLNRIQQHQQYIQRQVAKKSTIITPIKTNNGKSPMSNKKTVQDSSQHAPGIQLPQSVKPFDSMTMRSTIRDTQFSRANVTTERKGSEEYNRQLQAKCARLERENQNQRRTIIQLQDHLRNADDQLRRTDEQIRRSQDQLKKNQQQLKRTEDQLRKSRNIPPISSINIRTNQQVQDLAKKIMGLQQQIDAKMLALTNAQRDLRSTREDFARLKQRSQRETYLLQNQRNTCKKAFEQQKQKSFQIQDNYNKLNQRCQYLQSKIKQKDLSGEQIRQQLKNEYQARQANIKKYYDDLYLNKQKDISQQLHQYLQALNNIRKDIQNINIDQVMKQSQSILNQRTTIEKQISYIRDQNQRIIQQLKTRLIQQQQRIIQLQKQNQLLKVEVHQLQVQKQKLKKAMFDFQVYKPVNVNLPTSTVTNITTTNYKFQQGCKVKNCLQETLRKIDNLQHQIAQILHE